KGLAVASLRREQDDRRVLLESVAALHAHGLSVDWKQLNGEQGQTVPLPTYPWQRERYWIEETNAVPVMRGPAAQPGEKEHPLLGRPFSLSVLPGMHAWEKAVSTTTPAYLTDHRVRGEAVMPVAAYVEMGLAAAASVFGQKPYVLEGASFERMLALPAKGARTVQAVLTEQQGGEASFQVSSQPEAGAAWVKPATAKLRLQDAGKEPARGEEPRRIRERCTTPIAVAGSYESLRAQGLEYGPAFQGVEELWRGPGEVLGRVRLPEGPATKTAGYQLHPALLDACFQAFGVLLPSVDEAGGERQTFIAAGLESLRVHGRPEREVWAHGRLRPAEKNARAYTWDVSLLSEAGQVLAEVKGLRVQRLEGGAGTRPVGEDWLHTLEWKRHEGTLSEQSLTGTGTWLVLSDAAGTGNALAGLLEARGQRCVKVVAAERYEKLEPGLFRVDATSPEDYRRVLKEALGDTGCRGVVHLWSLDAGTAGPEELERAWRRGSQSALYLAQALVRRGWRDMPGLWLVTQGAHAVTRGDRVSVAQAPLWGFGRALELEHPELRTTLVDVEGNDARARARALVAELGAGDGETQVAWREDSRYVARLSRGTYEALGGEPVELEADATYLLTGGLEAPGVTVARWMVERGARNLVLLERGEPSEAGRQTLQELEKSGARVVVERADASKREQVEAVLKRMAAHLPPLRGVMHAARATGNHTVLELNGERFSGPLDAGARGAWNLHALTADRPLDFFVLHASAESVLGLPGRSHHAAAHSFLDALAHHRRSQGLAGLSLDWGVFAEGTRGDRTSSGPLEAIEPEQGTAVLERLLAGTAAQVVVMRLEARRWVEFYPGANASAWSELLRAQEKSRAQEPGASHFRQSLLDAPTARRQALLEEHLAGQMARVLRLEASRIDRLRALGELGLDSLMSLELRNRLEASLGLKLSVTLLFTYPNLAALAEYLLGELVPASAAGEPPPPRPADDATSRISAQVEQLSKEELLEFFDKSFGIA
ncbi:MAG TPA: type I polyketide synthase, partial [Archangium sp.]|nr:type I polyketide synthase [Archangium sp.]